MKDKSETIQNIADMVEEQLLMAAFKELKSTENIDDVPAEMVFDFFHIVHQEILGTFARAFEELATASEGLISAIEQLNEK